MPLPLSPLLQNHQNHDQSTYRYLLDLVLKHPLERSLQVTLHLRGLEVLARKSGLLAYRRRVPWGLLGICGAVSCAATGQHAVCIELEIVGMRIP